MARNVEHVLTGFAIGDNESLKNAMRNLAEFDNDFNGSNGPEYVDFDGYDSNMEAIIDKVMGMNLPNEVAIIREYVSQWLDHDSYYEEYSLLISNKDIDKKYLSVSLVATHID